MNVTIVGLGLIGGSIAKALNGFCDCNITGVDKNPAVTMQALADGAIHFAENDACKALACADLAIICLYPKAFFEFIEKYSTCIKQGCIVTDVTGVKDSVVRRAQQLLGNNAEFIGGHPMAGREFGGYENSFKELFKNANYIITKTEQNAKASVELVEQMAQYIGCKTVTVTTPEHHDEMIAYTSQLMHVVASALCDNPQLYKFSGFDGGSFADCTRVARLNAPMWSDLYIHNKHNLVESINKFEKSLDTIKQYIISEDFDGLSTFMQMCSDNKKKTSLLNSNTIG